MNNNECKTKGITLIALVITIIILIILAGITLSSLTGEKSIIKEARSSKEIAEMKSLEEQIEVAIIVAEQKSKDPTFEQVKTEIEKIETVTKVEDNGDIVNTLGDPITGKLDSYLGKESGDEDVPVEEGIKPGELVEKTEKYNYRDRDGDKATIPQNFIIVPGCEDISEGLVISDGKDDTELDSNNIVAQGNQFVWIPVSDETKYERNKTYGNPNIIPTSYDETGYLPTGITNVEQTVRNAGGFYIARYEAGVEGTTTLVSKKERTVWTYIDHSLAKGRAKNLKFKDTAYSCLISGVQWDLTMAFISSKPRKDGEGNVYDVTKTDSNRHKGDSVKVELSGSNNADKVCNIYDLEGNAGEMTAEKNTYNNSSYPVNTRGGTYSSNLSAAYRNGSGSGKGTNVTFRVALLIKFE